MADWKLLIEDDAGKTIVVPLVRDVITIGRKEGNTIRLTERNVSRFHARLEKAAGHVFIEDLESYNGVKINGDRIKGRVEIREGDLIEIGDYHLALQSEGASEPVPPAAATSAPAPASMDASLEGVTQDFDDEFAGDTQRWEPPASMDPLPLGGPATTEDPGLGLSDLDLGETARFAPAPGTDAEPTMEERRPAPISSVGPGTMPAPFPTALDEAAPEETVKSPSAPHLTAPGPDAETERFPLSGEGLALADVAPAPVSSSPAPAPSPLPAPAPSSPPAAASPAAPSGVPAAVSSPAVPGLEEERTEAVPPAPASDRHLIMPRLVALNTVFAGTVFPIVRDEVEVGRTEENDLIIQHKSVSRSHCKLVREGDKVRIHDLKSANGILVNGEERDNVVLRSGDVIELGRVRLRFVPAGERFELSPEEIERARVADVSGEEWNDEGTFVTSAQHGGVSAPFKPARSGSPLLLLAAVGGLVVLGVVAFFFLGGEGGEKSTAGTSEPPGALEQKPLSAEASKFLAQGRSYLAEGRWEDAITALEAAEAQGAGDVARKEILRAEGEKKAERILGDIKRAYDAKEWDEVRRLADTVPTDFRAYPEARKYADSASEKLADNLHQAAGKYLDDKRTGDASDTLDRLRRIEGDSARVKAIEQRLGRLEDNGDGRLKRGRRPGAKRPRASAQAASKRDDKREDKREDKPAAKEPSPEETAARIDALETEAQQLLLQGETGGAIRRLKEALKLSPRRSTLHRQLTLAYKTQGNLEKARYHFERYKRLNPTARDIPDLEARLK